MTGKKWTTEIYEHQRPKSNLVRGLWSNTCMKLFRMQNICETADMRICENFDNVFHLWRLTTLYDFQLTRILCVSEIIASSWRRLVYLCMFNLQWKHTNFQYFGPHVVFIDQKGRRRGRRASPYPTWWKQHTYCQEQLQDYKFKENTYEMQLQPKLGIYKLLTLFTPYNRYSI